MAGKFADNTMSLTAAAKAVDDEIDRANQAAETPLFLAAEDERNNQDSETSNEQGIVRGSVSTHVAFNDGIMQQRKKATKQRASVESIDAGDDESMAQMLDAMKETPLVQFSIRIPDAINQEIEDELHERKKRKEKGISKQGIVTEALLSHIERRRRGSR